MSKRRYLFLDCDYLVHRAKHVFGELSYSGSATGVIYGFLRDILELSKRFNTERLIFCWDSKNKIRKKMYPQYKANRKHESKSLKEKKFDEAFYKQVALLKNDYLTTIGFRNIFCQDGYEADDLIAELCKGVVTDLEDAVIITADQDMFQLIRENIYCYNPQTKKILTLKKFKNQYHITPYWWAQVKAIAGCPSDNIKGIEGVGEKTAIKYVRGKLGETTKAFRAIKQGKIRTKRNIQLVKLPLKGTQSMRIESDSITQRGWDKVTKTLGMKSIRFRSIRL
jgi:DNA polymerase I